jgi:hypothetical protein
MSYSCALKLPARLAWLARGFAIILVRESFPPASSTTAATGTRTAAPRYFRTRFVHFEVASAELFSVEGRNGLGGFFVVGHFDKGKSMTKWTRVTCPNGLNSSLNSASVV